MCGGGGGGPDPRQIKRDEDLRNLKNQQSVAAINSIFGVTDPAAYQIDNDLLTERAWIDEMLAPKDYQIPYDDGDQSSGWYVNPRTSRVSREPQYRQGYAFEEILPEETDDYGIRQRRSRITSPTGWSYSGYTEQDLAEKLRQAAADIPDYNATGYVTDAERNRQSIDQQYSTTRQDIVDYFREELDRQKADAEQSFKTTLARRGLSGGQAQITGGADLMRTYNEGLLGITNRADATVSGLRESDDTARRDLISQIYSGLDSQSALASATNRLRSNADSAFANAKSEALGNIFGDFADRYKLAQYTAGQQGAPKAGPPVQVTGATVTPNSYSGTQGSY